jgi:hypothetical protein
VNISPTLIADSQSSELVEPTDRSLYHPAERAQATAMFGVPVGKHRLNPSVSELVSVGLRVVGTICKDRLGTGGWMANLPGDRRDVIHQGDQLRHVMPMASRQPHSQRNPVGVSDQVMLRTAFPSIYRAGTGTFAPPTARTCELSTMAADRSSRSLARSRSRRVLCTLSRERIGHPSAPCVGPAVCGQET